MEQIQLSNYNNKDHQKYDNKTHNQGIVSNNENKYLLHNSQR